MPTVGEMLGYSPPEVCVCGQLIPGNAVYYGFPLSVDNDEPVAWVNEWHEHCLAEWGVERCSEDDPEGIAGFGIKHRWCAEREQVPA